MKRIFITAIILCVAAASLVAQQIPLNSSTYFMRLLYNPALTGYNGSTNVYGYYRDQWTGLPGHPVTMGGMGEISLAKEQCNIGVHVYNDVTSIISNTGAQLYYAQKIKLAKDHHLSLGVSVGILNTHVDYANAIANDVNDPNILVAGKSGLGFDMNAGIAYQWKKLTVGFAVPHLAQTNVVLADQTKSASYDALRHYVAHASYEFSFKKETWNLEPSIMFKKGSSAPYQLEGAATANYKRFLYLGIGYRQSYGMSFMGAVRIARCVTLGYTYEYPLASAVSYGNTKGTHEVIVGINFDKWIKNPELKKQKLRIDTLEQRANKVDKIDTTLAQKMDSLEQANAQLAKDADAAREANKAQDARINSLQQQLDTLQGQIDDYKRRIASKPVGNFSALTDKDQGNIKQGDIIKLDQVYFETNSSYLKKESFVQLDKLAEVLKASPDMKIRVIGHTDYIASDLYNMWLSERRAKRVADYLTSRGVSADKITSAGYGKRSPIADNSTEEGRALNRRVEIDVTKK